MKYSLFPRLDFLSHLRRVHVAYHPHRQQTEVAKRLIMRVTSEAAQRMFPQLEASWELLAYDAPATIDVEFADGTSKRYAGRFAELSGRALQQARDAGHR